VQWGALYLARHEINAATKRREGAMHALDMRHLAVVGVGGRYIDQPGVVGKQRELEKGKMKPYKKSMHR
jgi:hypothetical protein